MQEEALLFLKQALQLLEESDRILRSQVAEERERLATQKNEREDKEKAAPQD